MSPQMIPSESAARKAFRQRISSSIVALAVAMFAASPLVAAAPAPDVAAAATEGKEWPELPRPSAKAPNVLLIMTDDVGFGSTSLFGGPVPTPNFEQLAEKGARYNGFNTTAICSPTRASLLTGRLPHNVGMGNVNNLATGYRGYTSVLPDDAATIAEILRGNGYATAMFGKWHLTPKWEQSSYGPFDRWPTGKGFDYFYGFDGGDTDQFAPALIENTLAIAPPTDDPDYILDKDLADRAIAWIRQSKTVAPDRPFFTYIAPGTAHSPLSAPKAWLDKFRGKFDMGWDRLREESFARQKKLGIVPANAKLTPRPSFLPAWDSLPDDRKRVYSRMAEAFAAALAYNDDQMGRVIDSLKQSGDYDNTLIIFIQGDNGASAEGGEQGLFAEEAFINGYPEPFDFIRDNIDQIGGPMAHNHMPAAWAWAMTTPFQYYKQVASHAGGTRNGMVVSWPGHVVDPRVVRSQFLHVSDIAPTIMEAAGITPPSVVDGHKQRPFDGISFAYTFGNAGAPPKRTELILETMQNMALFEDGWMASSRPEAAPWEITTKSMNVAPGDRVWELYDLGRDFSQSNDLARKYPDRLAAMKARFFKMAAVNNILPVHGIAEGSLGRPTISAGRGEFVFKSRLTRLPENTAPVTKAQSFTIDADVTIDDAKETGVLTAMGGRFGGFALYLKDGVPTFHYNMTGPRQFRIKAAGAIGTGPKKLTARFDIDKPEPGAGGTLTLLVDGKKVGQGRIENTYRTWLSNTEGFDIGEDSLTPVSEEYSVAGSRFGGRIDQIVFRMSKP